MHESKAANSGADKVVAASSGSPVPATSAVAKRDAAGQKVQRLTQAERSAAMRRRLLDAATTHLAEVGFAAFKVESVAQKAAVTRGAIHHQFGSRSALLSELVQELGSQLLELSVPEGHGSARQRLDAAIDHDWAIIGSIRFVAVLQILLGMKADDELYRRIISEVTAFEKQLDEAWTRMLAPEVAPERVRVIRHVVSSTLRGLTIRSIYHGRILPSTEEVQLLREMVRGVL